MLSALFGLVKFHILSHRKSCKYGDTLVVEFNVLEKEWDILWDMGNSSVRGKE